MRILITGGAGFIGSHLAERMLREGREITVLDDLSTGWIENLRGAFDYPGFEFVEDSASKLPRPNASYCFRRSRIRRVHHRSECELACCTSTLRSS